MCTLLFYIPFYFIYYRIFKLVTIYIYFLLSLKLHQKEFPSGRIRVYILLLLHTKWSAIQLVKKHKKKKIHPQVYTGEIICQHPLRENWSVESVIFPLFRYRCNLHYMYRYIFSDENQNLNKNRRRKRKREKEGERPMFLFSLSLPGLASHLYLHFMEEKLDFPLTAYAIFVIRLPG